MGLILDNKGISSMTFNGKKVKECWLNGVKVWPNYPDLDPVIAQITLDLGNMPLHYCKFDGYTTQTPLLIGDVYNYATKFISIPNSPKFEQGLGGRKALKCSYVDISLAQLAKAQYNVFISMLIKQTTKNSSYSGVLGGTIFGLNTEGLGYALGWGSSIQGNKICAESYAGGSAAAAYNTVMTTDKWYHVMAEFRSPITATGGGTPTSYLSVNGSSFVQANGAGSIGSPLDYSDLSVDQGDSYIHLGCTWQGGQRYFKGLIQDFVLWIDDRLTDTHVELLKNYYRELGVY